METTTSKLILACYCALALIVVVIGFFIYRAQSLPSASYEIPLDRPASTRPARPFAASAAFSQQLRLDIERQRERIQELQSLLEKRETILQQQKLQLETKSAESERLQDEADRYLGLLMGLVQESADSIDDNLDILRQADDQISADNDAQTGNEPPTVESLEAALMAAEWELQQMTSNSTARELAVADQTSKLSAVQQAIQSAGESAVPVLIGLMSDETDTELRAWSATTLGPLAAGSLMARDALLIAAEDRDPEVRNAARQAIQLASERQ